MKKFYTLLLVAILGITAQVSAQESEYWVGFSDKNETTYSLDTPEDYLSPRALQRRANQNIAIDSFDLPVCKSYMTQISATGARVVDQSKWLNGVLVRVPKGTTAIIDVINALDFVVLTELVYETSGKGEEGKRIGNAMMAKGAESTAGKKAPVFTEADYGDALNPIKQLNGIPLHDDGFMGQGMLITVMDVGFSNVDSWDGFAPVRNNGQIIGTYDVVREDAFVYDFHGHGTSCFSQIGANKPGTMIGVAPMANFFLLKSEYPTAEYYVEHYKFVIGSELADSIGTDVLSASLGYNAMQYYDFDKADLDGVTLPSSRGTEIAASRGMLMVIAAGNEGSAGLGFPSDSYGSFTIGAVDAGGNRGGFSSVGPTADGRLMPHVCAQGAGGVLLAQSGTFTSNGTSFATPLIAGMSACLWQKHPCATRGEIEEAIKKAGHQYDTPDNLIGYGIPDFVKASQFLSSCQLPPTARAESSNTAICTGETVDYTDNSYSEITNWNWTFEGGTPATSTDANPTVTYNTDGEYDVQLIVENPYGKDTINWVNYINVGQVSNLPIVEGFEGSFPPAGWGLNNPDDGLAWHQRTDYGSQSTSSSLVMNNADNSVEGEIDEIYLPNANFDIEAVTIEMTFDVAYTKFNDGSEDILQVHASKDCGKTWEKLWEKNNVELETKVVDQGDSNGWAPENEDDWRGEKIDLTSYKGESQVMLKFTNVSGYGTRIWVDNINIERILGIGDLNLGNKLSIYPNPSTGLVNLKLDTEMNEAFSIKVSNVVGQTIHSLSIGKQAAGWSTSFDLSEEGAGVYMIEIIGKSGSETRKIIVE